MRISKSIAFFLIFSLGTLFAYGWIGSDRYFHKDKPRPVLGSFPVPATFPALQRSLESFTADLKLAMSRENIPGMAFTMVYDGLPVTSAGFGVTDLGDPSPVDMETIFRLASLSKGFAPVLVGMLVDEGLINWDDPLVKYLPDFKLYTEEATRQLTVRHILSHTTGLPRHAYSNLLNMRVPFHDIVRQLRGVPLAHQPGTWYNYQNVAYSLISDVVEKVTGIPYDRLLEDRLFKPLGMHSASVGFENMRKTANAAQPHGRSGSSYYRLVLRDSWYDVSPAAGVNASANDLSLWLQLLMGKHPGLISAESLAEITRQQVAVSPMEGVMRPWRPMDQSAYGLGWRIVEKFGRKILFHGGFVNGYRAEIGFCPEEKIGLAILSNGSNYFLRDALPIFFEQYFTRLAME